MSRSQFNSNNRKVAPHSAPQRMHCKVCQDAGKSVEIYTSHRVKDRDGKTTCTTLLSQECRYCYETGHTVKFCPILTEREQEKQRENKLQAALDSRMKRAEVEEKRRADAASAPAPKKAGRFAALESDSEDEKPQPKVNSKPKVQPKAQPKEEFPALSANVTLRPHQRHFAKEDSKVSFASALKAPPPVVAEPIPYLKTTIKSTAKVTPASAASAAAADALEPEYDSWDEYEADAAKAPAPVQFNVNYKYDSNGKVSWAAMCDSDDEEW